MHGYSVFTWKRGTAVCMDRSEKVKRLYIGKEKRIFKRNNNINGQGAGLDNIHGGEYGLKRRNKWQGKEMYNAGYSVGVKEQK